MSWADLLGSIKNTASELTDTVGEGLSAIAESRIQREVQRGQESAGRPETVRPDPVDPYVGDAKVARDQLADGMGGALKWGAAIGAGALVLALVMARR